MDVGLTGGSAIVLPPEVRARIVEHARDEAPKECCGLLFGQGRRIAGCVPTTNVAPDPARGYVVDPAQHIALNRRLRESGQSVVGCYHSHPKGGVTPSPTDVAQAAYPGFIWIIVSLSDPERPVMAAFLIENEEWSPLPIR